MFKAVKPEVSSFVSYITENVTVFMSFVTLWFIRILRNNYVFRMEENSGQ